MRRGAPFARYLPRRRHVAGAAAAAWLLASGCAGSGEANPRDLTTRALEYMALRQAGNWEEIWTGMLDPEVKAGLQRDPFMQKRRSSFDILEFDIVSVDEQGEQGRVVARMDAVVPILKPGGGTMRLPRELDDSQEWVLREGRWYIQLPG